MNKKKIAITIILIISAIFNTAGASEKIKDRCAFFNSNAAKGDIVVSIPYGEKDNEITRVSHDKIKNSLQAGYPAFTADKSGNIYVNDDAKQKVLKFNADDKNVSKLSSAKDVSNIAVEDDTAIHEGKTFAVLMESDELSVVNAADTKEIELKYPVNSKDGTMRVSDARLIGIDASGNFYMHIVVLKNDGTIVENDIMKFKKGGILSRKMRVPYYIIGDSATIFTGKYILLKENVVLSHKIDDEKHFKIISFEIK